MGSLFPMASRGVAVIVPTQPRGSCLAARKGMVAPGGQLVIRKKVTVTEMTAYSAVSGKLAGVQVMRYVFSPRRMRFWAVTMSYFSL